MADLKENRKIPIYENEPIVDRNYVTVLVVSIDDFAEYRKKHDKIVVESDLTYREAVKLARGEYSLFDLVRLMNTNTELQIFHPDKHIYIPVDHRNKIIVKGGFDTLDLTPLIKNS